MSVNAVIGATAADRVFRGEDRIIPDTITVDGTPTGTPIDITAWHLRFSMVGRYGSSTVEIVKDNSGNGGLVITNGALGQLQISLAHADTMSLPVGAHWWDCRRTDNGVEVTVSDGILILSQEVTAG